VPPLSSSRTSNRRPASETLLEFLTGSARLWQMKFGERCALEGILSVLRPDLAIEIGTAQGGSVARVAAHSQETHSFDLVDEVTNPDQLDNVHFHVGDSAELLPEFLAELAASGRNVDFVLVDGDHSAEGVERDARALLESDACSRTVVVFHDAANEEVRAGLEALDLAAQPKVALVSLDFVPGYVVAEGVRRLEIWNGLALAVLDESRRGDGALVDTEIYDAAALNRRMRDLLTSEAGGNGGDPAGVAQDEARADLDGIPERFVPGTIRAGLAEAEHMARYWWASQFASGRKVLDAGCGTGYGSNILAETGATGVTGVDISAPVIEAAQAAAAPGAEFEVGDITSLALDDGSVDLIVCLETLEHVDEPERALDELARVLTPDGLLVVSSPNRDVYPPGNPHHRREFTPDELREELGRRFGQVELMRQHDWNASAILDDAGFAADGGATLSGVVVRKLVGHQPGRETYTLAVATNGTVPEVPVPLALTHSIELREWLENYDAQERILRQQTDALRAYETLGRERLELRKRLEEAELRLARVPELELALAARDRDRSQLIRRLEGSDQALREVMSSPSWRMTSPLRRVKALVRQILSP
jgi:2-polyprenyl-3-methyl-5-hydroxy-6-metoxy-1,4-benzoquinol methylase